MLLKSSGIDAQFAEFIVIKSKLTGDFARYVTTPIKVLGFLLNMVVPIFEENNSFTFNKNRR